MVSFFTTTEDLARYGCVVSLGALSAVEPEFAPQAAPEEPRSCDVSLWAWQHAGTSSRPGSLEAALVAPPLDFHSDVTF